MKTDIEVSQFRLGVLGIQGGLLASSLFACTQPNPVFCDQAQPCPEAQRCTIDTNVCVAAPITLSGAGVMLAGDTVWSTTDAPTLRGTVSDNVSALTVSLGNAAPIALELVDHQWTLKLPAGAAVAAGTQLTLALTTPQGQVAERYQLKLDASPPTLTLQASSAFDESDDEVQLDEQGVPRHRHRREVRLAPNATSCTTTIKYAHLMDAAPAFATEQTALGEPRPNPIIWRASAQSTGGLALAQSTVTLRVANTSSIVTTTSLEAYASRRDDGYDFAIPMTTAFSPDLARTGQTLRVELNVVDWAGRASKVAFCWQHQLLPAPIRVGAITLAARAPSHWPHNAGEGPWGTQQLAPLSTLINGGTEIPLYEASLVAGTTHETLLRLPLAPALLRHTHQDRHTVAYQPKHIIGDPFCRASECVLIDRNSATHSIEERTAASTSMALQAFVIDEQTGQRHACNDRGCLLQGRALDEPPRRYRLTIATTGQAVSELNPTRRDLTTSPTRETPFGTGVARNTGNMGCEKIKSGICMGPYDEIAYRTAFQVTLRLTRSQDDRAIELAPTLAPAGGSPAQRWPALADQVVPTLSWSAT